PTPPLTPPLAPTDTGCLPIVAVSEQVFGCCREGPVTGRIFWNRCKNPTYPTQRLYRPLQPDMDPA
ncbi:MAG: hypothetical protein J2P36_35335, partial [Ktedonobacteraceae bacterium]|nr:hypothetical protein [Ktedonobacteraceae bacterium]